MTTSKDNLLPTTYNVASDRRVLNFSYNSDKSNTTLVRDSSDYTRLKKIGMKKNVKCGCSGSS
tara:strand:- start:7760 stop:7948 length:189 start_codon:yes stop_codon:yes gene_type:complete